ncbi:MAG: DNA polymerase III subunit beta [Spirochaetaceae bacterium]|nr:MAG: DNA polymerase III subunit beta [Spirochaetaceae bacterium]
MKFACDRDALLKEISVAAEIISSRNTLSILSNVFVDARDNAVTIRATDLKVGFETRLPVEVVTPGRTTIYCDKLLSILRTLPDGDVDFELKDNGLFTIHPRTRKVDFRLKSIDAEKFPEIHAAADELYFEVAQKDFIEMVGQTIFAVSDDETRYFMNGVYMEQIEGELVMVATDGRRLSFVKRVPGTPVPEFAGVIIPPKVLQLVRKLASGEGNFLLAVTDKNIFVRFDNRRISSALIEGQFPNYRRVIPENQQYELSVSKADLTDALKRVSLLVEKSRRIYIELSENRMAIAGEESDIGTATEEVSCQYHGPENRIALNYLYLSEPLRVIDTDNVTLQYTEANKAITVHSSPRKEYFHIVMPMQLD